MAVIQRYVVLLRAQSNLHPHKWTVTEDLIDTQINTQIGLDNLQTITSHISAVAKTELRTAAFLGMTPALAKYPVISFDSNKSVYFAGKPTPRVRSLPSLGLTACNIIAYLPDKLDLDGKLDGAEFDEELSSCFFGVHIPADLCPPSLGELSRSQNWDLVSKVLGDWAKE